MNLIERLRAGLGDASEPIRHEAADEIEWLELEARSWKQASDLKAAEIERLRRDNSMMRGTLQDIWDDGIQDGLSDDLRNKVEHCLGITPEQGAIEDTKGWEPFERWKGNR